MSGFDRSALRAWATIASERAPWKRVDIALTASLVALKLYVLHRTWGSIQGFDALLWIGVFRLTRWDGLHPGAMTAFNSYHPPLSYLLGHLIYAVYPHEVAASQILSTVAMLGAVFALRSVLRTIGVLYTVPGLALLSMAASMPLVVWLAVETSYDPLVFMWFVVAMALSVRLFWKPVPAAWWRDVGSVLRVTALGLVLAAGMLTKFNTLVAFALPFLVILVRRKARPILRDLSAALAAVTIGTVAVAPYYYERYYMPFRRIFPQPIEWLRAADWHAAVTQRDANPWAFLRHLLRVPAQPITGTQYPLTDSFLHSIWLQLWKRDIVLGPQGELSLAVSDVYVRVFAFVLVAATLLFAFRHRRTLGPWRDLGYVLLAVAAVYCLLLVYFGWKYPVWDWRVIKAKYITPAVLWMAYCAVLPFVGRRAISDATPRRRPHRLLEDLGTVVLLVLLAIPVLFMLINHLLPVY